MRVPGFVGEVMDFCMHAARYPNLPMAFCGAMALQSFLCSRKVREEGGLRPNLYMLALADSGTGKAFPRKVNSHILGKIGYGRSHRQPDLQRPRARRRDPHATARCSSRPTRSTTCCAPCHPRRNPTTACC